VKGVDPFAFCWNGRISWISPLARALIKARCGDVIRFQSPVGVRELDIVDVRYESLG
jgi:transcription elongation factor GreB